MLVFPTHGYNKINKKSVCFSFGIIKKKYSNLEGKKERLHKKMLFSFQKTLFCFSELRGGALFVRELAWKRKKWKLFMKKTSIKMCVFLRKFLPNIGLTSLGPAFMLRSFVMRPFCLVKIF